MSSELYQTIEMIGREKGLDTDVVIQAIEEAYAAATRKYYQSKKDFGARFDPETGHFEVFAKHIVVENEDEIVDPQTEVTLEEARKMREDAEIGDVLETPHVDAEAPLTRIAAQAAKQVIYQKVKEAERELIWHEYHDRVGELLTGQVKRFDRGDMVVDLGRTEGVVPRREQSRAEHYNPGDRIRAVLINVERQGKGPQLILSRADPILVKKMFEMEVPEIYDSTVEIVSVSRDAGERSKVAVASRDRDVDPVGACVGMKGSRVQAVIRELRGEKIDIVQYDDDPSNYVRNALNPAQINRVGIRDYENRDMEVIVAEDQLSLAIGKRGQNVRLASKLVGWNLDIKSEAEKKAEVEAEMERMAMASQELASLPGIDPSIGQLLLEAGFRAVEEVVLASMEDLTAIEGIDEDTAVELHDSAETLLDQWNAEAAAAAEAGEQEGENGDEAETAEADDADETVEVAEAETADDTAEDASETAESTTVEEDTEATKPQPAE
ncbi:MAG: transcription termination/antitermination protein NusA [Acidobacteria bacterium]|nr:transcription termination/antitermination protein NusA [Acidobacteriota bacterium]NIM63083.1 transcription termination/antitermination protein NusA [Acidobacteriota bacterium]NIO60794.1 transcription termination/antitermination protein NusA [Acidobacteriota bacterium]NIQ31866.1 transcription termination/antitermination protein NusA [Acidobacteriota bacterium]NIQ87243.1 transcription termination/antitermination protein NusA [Acidobacteriota bacterium]